MKASIAIALSRQPTEFIKKEGLDPVKLALAFASVESGLNPLACRYEEHYRWLYYPKKFARMLNITLDTEEVMQKTSWGLFQLMGATAREYGYKNYLHLLATPETINTQVELWVKHLSRLYGFYKRIDLAISGYNAGFGLKEPTSYYNKIMKAYNKG